MTRNDVCSLVQKSYSSDAIGVMTATETLVETPCRVDSVSASEWMDGGRIGLKPEYRFVMFAGNYSGETEVEYNSVRYTVYRTYRNGKDIEMYAEKKAGV